MISPFFFLKLVWQAERREEGGKRERGRGGLRGAGTETKHSWRMDVQSPLPSLPACFFCHVSEWRRNRGRSNLSVNPEAANSNDDYEETDDADHDVRDLAKTRNS